jgi:hypothetical protein
MERVILLLQRIARENAPGGVDPFQVDVLDVKAGLLLGLSENEAIEVGQNETLRRVFKYARICIQKKVAEQE